MFPTFEVQSYDFVFILQIFFAFIFIRTHIYTHIYTVFKLYNGCTYANLMWQCH